MSRLDDIKARAEQFVNLCPDYLAQGIRHLERNCDLFCYAEMQNPDHDCKRPDRYDGEAMAVALSDLAALVAVVEEVQRVRDTMLANEGKWMYLDANYAGDLTDALRPLTEEGQK